jgi:hypothetical protein
MGGYIDYVGSALDETDRGGPYPSRDEKASAFVKALGELGYAVTRSTSAAEFWFERNVAWIAEVLEAADKAENASAAEVIAALREQALPSAPDHRLREALGRLLTDLEPDCSPLAGDPENSIDYNEGICDERGRIAGILDSLLSPEAASCMTRHRAR